MIRALVGAGRSIRSVVGGEGGGCAAGVRDFPASPFAGKTLAGWDSHAHSQHGATWLTRTNSTEHLKVLTLFTHETGLPRRAYEDPVLSLPPCIQAA